MWFPFILRNLSPSPIRPRDKKKGKLQIIFGLLCNAAAWTIAVEVFEGNINDAKTLSPVLEKVGEPFGIKRLVIEAEAHLDRMYVIHTSVCAEELDDSETVKAFKSLSQIEQEFLWDSGKTGSCNETHFWTFSPSKFSDVADEFGNDE